MVGLSTQRHREATESAALFVKDMPELMHLLLIIRNSYNQFLLRIDD